MNTVSFSEARQNLKSVLDRVVDDSDITIIKRRDQQDAVVMSLDEYNSMQETMYLLSSPANARHLMESIEQIKKGQVVKKDLIDD